MGWGYEKWSRSPLPMSDTLNGVALPIIRYRSCGYPVEQLTDRDSQIICFTTEFLAGVFSFICYEIEPFCSTG